MPARDTYHDDCKAALIKDGWTITHDPFTLTYGPKDLFVDLGAERLLAAERGTERIAVEIKSFLGASEMADLEQALGQYILYHSLLTRVDPARVLFLAVSEAVQIDVFDEPVGRALLEDGLIRLVVFNPHSQEIVRWIP
jgi:hypothetical protein